MTGECSGHNFAIDFQHRRKILYTFERETIEYAAFDGGSNRETKDQVAYLLSFIHLATLRKGRKEIDLCGRYHKLYTRARKTETKMRQAV